MEQPLNQIEKVLVDHVGVWDDLLQMRVKYDLRHTCDNLHATT
jgi:hypothetical protein